MTRGFETKEEASVAVREISLAAWQSTVDSAR